MNIESSRFPRGHSLRSRLLSVALSVRERELFRETTSNGSSSCEQLAAPVEKYNRETFKPPEKSPRVRKRWGYARGEKHPKSEQKSKGCFSNPRH